MPAPWKMLYAGAVSGTMLGELPVIEFTHTDVLNGVGTWSATVPFDEDDTVEVPNLAGGIDIIDRTSELDFPGLRIGQCVVYFERNGRILGQGLPWGIDLDYAAGTMQITGAGLGSYFARSTTPGFTFATIDQGAIVDFLITQSQVEGALPMEPPGVLTGVHRDRTYVRNESKPLLETIEQLAAVNNGFDFMFRAAWESGAIVHRCLLQYPATGRVTDIVFEVGVNAAVLTYSEDGGDLANRMNMIGAGEGDDKVFAYTFRPGGLGPEELCLDGTSSHIDVSNYTTLLQHSAFELQRRGQPIRRLQLVLIPDVIPALGDFEVGDRVWARANRGWLRFDELFRIVEVAVSYGDGDERVTLTLASAEAFE